MKRIWWATYMGKSVDAIEMAREYSCLQAKLVAATRVAYPEIEKDTKCLLFLSHRGEVRADDERWTFVKHGVGIRYVGTFSGRVVDPHVGVIDYPGAIDSWRFWQYLDSISVPVVWFESERHDVRETEGINLLLAAMAGRGVLAQVSQRRRLHLYLLAGIR